MDYERMLLLVSAYAYLSLLSYTGTFTKTSKTIVENICKKRSFVGEYNALRQGST